MTEFTITKNHLLLIQNMRINCSRYNIVDMIRPYGNSDVIGDIAYILDMTPDDNGSYSLAETSYMEQLHKEIPIILQICICLLKFEEGTYVKRSEDDNTSWLKKA